MARFKVWKTLVIGGVSPEQLLDRMDKVNGGPVNHWVRAMMMESRQFTTLPKLKKVCLGRVCLKELGFSERTTTANILARARDMDGICPPEVGPHLWFALAAEQQSQDDSFWVAADPMSSWGATGLFGFANKASLYCDLISSGRQWLPANKFVVMLPE